MEQSHQHFNALNTWELIIQRLKDSRFNEDIEKKIDIIIEILVNLRLLDKEEKIQDRREKKEHIDIIYKEIRDEAILTLKATHYPTDEYLYYFRELLKKLPLRSGGNDLIEEIRSASEAFEESRNSDDPFLSFAADLRKEAHRKLSPKILTRYIVPYLEFVKNKNPIPMQAAGYFFLASNINSIEEDNDFILLAEELQETLSYLWDYENGDIVTVKKSLSKNEKLFEKCFLKREMQTFIGLLSPEYIAYPDNLYDCLKRLALLKEELKNSYFEKRIDFYDYLNADLDIGRLIFIFTNDLSNNHYDTITIKNIKEAMGLLETMIAILNIKGIILKNNDRLLNELKDIRDLQSIDILGTKRCIQNISQELQDFHKNSIFNRLGHMLNNVLEAYQVPTSSLSPIKDRFLNNFIRRTESHVVSDFIEKLMCFLNKELSILNTENNLYGKYRVTQIPSLNKNFVDFFATTWNKTTDDLRPYLGGKGNSLIDMKNFGMNIPPAFIISLPVCHHFFNLKQGENDFRNAVRGYLTELENICQRKLGNPKTPLFVSVRSGATMSLPGAMCTVLNVGITPEVREEFKKRNGESFSNSIYLRFLKNCIVALDYHEDFIKTPKIKERNPNRQIEELEHIIKKKLGASFLEDPFEQLLLTIELVFRSSRSQKVQEHLKELSIELKYGTPVTVQQMVFGNRNPNSLSGVFFTRNPVNGSNELFGEYKELTQGEDVVMGNVITKDIGTIAPEIRFTLLEYKKILEKKLLHELDIEFTVEDGVVYLLQMRRARLSAFAKLVVNIDMLKTKLIALDQFKARLERLCITNNLISIPKIDEDHKEWNPPICEGVPISHGIVSGLLILTPERFEESRKKRENIIYFTLNTKPSDFFYINNSSGIVTVFPGGTSHAAITAITLNKPCIVGCSGANINLKERYVHFKDKSDTIVKEGELITIDANTGNIFKGTTPFLDGLIHLNEIWDAVVSEFDPDVVAQKAEAIVKENLNALKRNSDLKKAKLSNLNKDELKDKNVLVRLDLNVPVKEGRILDDDRIVASYQTIDSLLASGATPILCSHLGDPGRQEKGGISKEEIYAEFSLRPISDYLKKRYPGIVFHDVSIATSGLLINKSSIQKGKINILENLRFAIGEKENDDTFANSLAALSDGYYVNDAFGACHRRHASIDAVTKYVHIKVAGHLIEKELKYLGKAIRNSEPPFVAIIGGAKISIKLGVIEALLSKVDYLIVGGGIAYTFLMAKGFEIQNSLVEKTMIEVAARMLEKYSEKIILPCDFVATNDFNYSNFSVKSVKKDVVYLKEGWESFDLGKKSLDRIIEILDNAKTIFWNGPIGVFENEIGAVGTMRLAKELAILSRKNKTVIVAGDDTVHAVRLAGVSSEITHASTGSAASLEFIERLGLPGLSLLDNE